MWGVMLGFGCWLSQPCEWQINLDTPLLVGQKTGHELRSTRFTVMGSIEQGWVDVSASVRVYGVLPTLPSS